MKERLIQREMNILADECPLGYIFMVGAVMGFVVGVVICYQIVYADIADHMREFATLKASATASRYFLVWSSSNACICRCWDSSPGLHRQLPRLSRFGGNTPD